MSNATEFQDTKHRAASKTRRSLVSSRAVNGSAKTDNPWAELKTISARAHGAYRDNLIAGAAIGRMQTNIVGTGIAARPVVDFKALGITEEAAKLLNEELARHYDAWAEDANECDIDRTLDFYQQQGLGLISCLLGGDVFCSTPNVKFNGAKYDLKLQLIEGERIANKDGVANTKMLHDGVEFGAFGAAPVKYHIRTASPADDAIEGKPTWDILDAFGAETGRRRVLHLFEKTRPGQVRGVSFLAPILEPLQLLDKWGSAELAAAVVGSMLTHFIERDQAGDGGPAFDTPEGGEAAQDQQPALALEGATVVDMAPGEKINSVSSAHPSPNFDPFFQSIVKSIGARIQIPLDELMLHYQSSYSAARAAMLQAWRFFRVRRGWLIQAFCQPLYELLIDELVATGKVNLPGYAENRAAYCAAHWIGDGRGAMDELKEAQAMAARVALGVSNLDMETMQSSGKSYEEVLRGRAKEIALQDELGVRDSTREPLVQQAVFTPAPEQKPAETPSKTDENAQ